MGLPEEVIPLLRSPPTGAKVEASSTLRCWVQFLQFPGRSPRLSRAVDYHAQARCPPSSTPCVCPAHMPARAGDRGLHLLARLPRLRYVGLQGCQLRDLPWPVAPGSPTPASPGPAFPGRAPPAQPATAPPARFPTHLASTVGLQLAGCNLVGGGGGVAASGSSAGASLSSLSTVDTTVPHGHGAPPTPYLTASQLCVAVTAGEGQQEQHGTLGGVDQSPAAAGGAAEPPPPLSRLLLWRDPRWLERCTLAGATLEARPPDSVRGGDGRGAGSSAGGALMGASAADGTTAGHDGDASAPAATVEAVGEDGWERWCRYDDSEGCSSAGRRRRGRGGGGGGTDGHVAAAATTAAHVSGTVQVADADAAAAAASAADATCGDVAAGAGRAVQPFAGGTCRVLLGVDDNPLLQAWVAQRLAAGGHMVP